MLSRTASELFWMARYLERAESYARVLDVTWKLSMIPRHSQQSRDLALPLNLSMTHELFQARHARFTMSNLLNFFALDGNNPCSICLLYTSDAADDLLCVDLGGRRILKKKKLEDLGLYRRTRVLTTSKNNT